MKQRRTRTRRQAATPLVSLWAALVVVFALVAPVLANTGPTKLYDPTASPRTATPTTTIVFEVSYRNREGSAPDHVSVVIDGVAHTMTRGAGTNWKGGVRSTWSTKLAVGTHTISFEAADTRKFSDAIAGGTVTITAPAPTPTPTPSATPTPKPTATPKPSPTPSATARPTAQPTATPRPTSTPGPTSQPTATPAPTMPGSSGGPGGPNPSQAPTSSPGATAQPTSPDGAGAGSSLEPGAGSGTGTTGGTAGSTGGGTDPTGPGSGGTGGTNPPDGTNNGPALGWGPGWGDGGGGRAAGATASDPTIGQGGLGTPAGAGQGTDATNPDGTTGAGKGRTGSGGGVGGHDTVAGGPGWGALSSALQTLGIDRPPTITILPMLVGTTGAMTMAFAFAIFGKKRRNEQPPAPDEVLHANAARGDAAVATVVRGSVVPAPVDIEAGMPRWRRPSLLEARKADPARSQASAQHRMSFDNGVVAVVEGRERRVIRYRVVSLLDAPDELRSADIGQLDQGDEVQLIEKSGTYWLVLCPDGRQGWVHKMTLGEVVSDATAVAAAARDGDDEDVLMAFLTARARA